MELPAAMDLEIIRAADTIIVNCSLSIAHMPPVRSRTGGYFYIDWLEKANEYAIKIGQ